jgi:hypothetical protein
LPFSLSVTAASGGQEEDLLRGRERFTGAERDIFRLRAKKPAHLRRLV